MILFFERDFSGEEIIAHIFSDCMKIEPM